MVWKVGCMGNGRWVGQVLIGTGEPLVRKVVLGAATPRLARAAVAAASAGGI